MDLWPASRPDGEPQAEPSSPAKPAVALKKSAPAHAKKGESPDEFHSPPPRAEERCNGKDAQAPLYPFCDL